MSFKRWSFCFLMILLVVGMAACSSREEKAQERFEEARQVERQGRDQNAEELYRSIVAQYPDTPSAQKALERAEQIKRVRERRLLKAALPILKSFQEVVEGYRAMYGRAPASVEDLDDGEFFFDSEYLAEQVPEGFEVYLSLADTSGGYRLWVLPSGAEIGFTLDGSGTGLKRLERAELLNQVGRQRSEQVKKGRLAFLKLESSTS